MQSLFDNTQICVLRSNDHSHRLHYFLFLSGSYLHTNDVLHSWSTILRIVLRDNRNSNSHRCIYSYRSNRTLPRSSEWSVCYNVLKHLLLFCCPPETLMLDWCNTDFLLISYQVFLHSNVVAQTRLGHYSQLHRLQRIIYRVHLYKQFLMPLPLHIHLCFVSSFHLSDQKFLPCLPPVYPPFRRKIPHRYLSGFFYQTVGEKGEF